MNIVFVGLLCLGGGGGVVVVVEGRGVIHWMNYYGSTLGNWNTVLGELVRKHFKEFMHWKGWEKVINKHLGKLDILDLGKCFESI